MIVLYVLVMSRTRFRVNPHSIVASMSIVLNFFVVDQDAQAYYIHLIIHVCVGARKANARGHTENPLKTRDFSPF